MLYLKRIVKKSSLVYYMYYYFMSFVLRVIGLFIKTNDKQILFVVYGGKRYDDSPRFIYEYMKSHDEYKEYKFVWAFMNPDTIEMPNENKVKIDTIHYYIEALRSKYWITNSSASRGINFMKKETINIYTQHGMAGIKKIGKDLKSQNKSFRLRFRERFDKIIIEGKHEVDILKRAWNVEEKVFVNIGLPRNDELVHSTDEDIVKLKKKLNIPLDKKVILYAPTFREYSRDSALATFLKPPFDFQKWYDKLGEEYILLLTAHYEVEKLLDIPQNNPFVINVFKYPYINDLMLCSDLLISDYSSIIFDYSILGKPIISYAYDYDEYKMERGLYDGYEDIFSQGVLKSQEQVIEFIKTMDYESECIYTKREIRDKYISNYGNATEKAVEAIFGNEL